MALDPQSLLTPAPTGGRGYLPSLKPPGYDPSFSGTGERDRSVG